MMKSLEAMYTMDAAELAEIRNAPMYEYEAFESEGAFLFPKLAYVAYVKGSCGDDICRYGPTPEAAIENLRQALED